ncbi:pilus (MSHA type) biogenesis protein MshL [Candidatus Magnetaquicoccus inordinatus]|uniref:pilus (MSHA type) biogenesis protein MshL n=1 Tax=Candidatus Magnetaquicoccus inordinatus TaxID=2496818 RepID=UPI00102CA7EB|nr:pilus (MSHA type) biogenesis protein MshL [Candidatus Magnetaquicoccus inordinatus]
MNSLPALPKPFVLRSLLACTLIWSGCSTHRTVAPAPPIERPAVSSSTLSPPSGPANRLPSQVDAALLPPLKSPSSQRQGNTHSEGPLIDVVVDSLPAKVFFMGLAEKSRTNIMVHPEVTANITLNLAQATIPQAVETVCKMYHFSCERTAQGYLIQPPRLVVRQYHIDYLRLQRSGITRTRVSAGQDVVSTSSSTDKDKGNTTSTQQVEMTGSQVVTQQQSHFWQELVLSLCGILGLGFTPNEGKNEGTATGTQQSGKNSQAGMLSWSWGPQSPHTEMLGCADHNAENGRRVVITPQSGDLLVRAYPSELQDVEQFLSGQKQILERQVILEAKILEITLNDGSQTGINWNLAFGKGAQSYIGLGGGGSLLGNANINPLFVDTTSGNFSPSNNSFRSTDSSSFGGAFAMGLHSGSFDSFIELLKTQGTVQVLSSPRVATLNNQKAVIRVGQDEYFVTEIRSENSSSTSSTNSANSGIVLIPRFTPFFSGIAMDVTPQISDDGHVMLHIHPMVSEVVTDQKQLTLGSSVQSYPVPLNRVRETDTIVKASDGEVVVIGGLMKDVEINRKAGIPGASDVPLLGRLFQHEQESTKKSELVILLRPRVVSSAASWQQELRRTAVSGSDPFAQGSTMRWSERSAAPSPAPAGAHAPLMAPNPGLDALRDSQ